MTTLILHLSHEYKQPREYFEEMEGERLDEYIAHYRQHVKYPSYMLLDFLLGRMYALEVSKYSKKRITEADYLMYYKPPKDQDWGKAMESFCRQWAGKPKAKRQGKSK